MAIQEIECLGVTHRELEGLLRAYLVTAVGFIDPQLEIGLSTPMGRVTQRS